ncbi:MAG: hypothetical protein ACREF8_05965 [Chthoniobacterales bacterium]
MKTNEKQDLANGIIGKEGNEHATKHGRKIESMNIRGAHGGGYVIEHHLAPKKSKGDGKSEPAYSYEGPQTHVAKNSEELMQHIGDNANRMCVEPTDGVSADQ